MSASGVITGRSAVAHRLQEEARGRVGVALANESRHRNLTGRRAGGLGKRLAGCQSREIGLTESLQQDPQRSSAAGGGARLDRGRFADRRQAALGLIVEPQGQADLGQVLLAARQPRRFAAAGHRHEQEEEDDADQQQHHQDVDGGIAGATSSALAFAIRLMAQSFVTKRASPDPTFPAASVARTISKWAPGLRSGKANGDLLAQGIEEAVVREEGRPGTAVEGIVGLHDASQAVGKHDDGLASLEA